MSRLRISSSKWIATVASIWILCSCGADTFSIYSSVLKSSQGYDQSTLDTVAFFKDFGSNSGVSAGLLYSAVTVNNSPRNWGGGGPWVVHVAGAIQNFFGYFMMWASVVGLIQRPPVALMCLFIFLSNHAAVFFATANLVTGVRNFPQSSGTIVGILKGFLGISGAIMVQAYGIFCKGKPSTFILMLALLPTFVSIVLMSFVRIYEANTVDDVKRLNGFSIVALIIAGYLLIILILANIFSLPLWAHIITFIFMLLLLASPLGIAIKAQREDSMRSSQMFSSESNHSKENQAKDSLDYHELPDGEGQVHDALDDKILPYEEGMNLLQALRTINFWLLFIAMVCGVGSGVAVVNNFSQIGKSLNYTAVEVNNLVTLWSICNFVGRIGVGYLSDYLLHTRGWTRPLLMAISLAAMTTSLIVFASNLPGILYIVSILVSLCYGSLWSLMPTITSEIFGVRHLGTIFNAISLACLVGSYIFSVKVIGYIYDTQAAGEDHSCFGTHCFLLSFLIMAFLALLGCLAAIALFFRTRQFYQLVVIRELKHYLR
ncbi:hypothetical protein SO802_020619 [Lithocarpus litseifolius]|uniref:Major facilitator superfamily (MFS) profile domain-containing protein n=1 Tax=Lithocarpus litseifolius TaxID=425828 RepID=A0AAW2CD15_9ROSI